MHVRHEINPPPPQDEKIKECPSSASNDAYKHLLYTQYVYPLGATGGISTDAPDCVLIQKKKVD
jgi:hypothetical protein